MSWRIDPDNPDKVHVALTEFHTLTVTHQPDEGIVLDVVDSRFTARGENDVVHTQCEDFETLNCCMDDECLYDDSEDKKGGVMSRRIPKYERDESWEHQQDLKAHVIALKECDIDGNTLIDPRTGIRYMECISCGMIMDMDMDERHSGGECNICHAINKDD